MHYLGVKFYTVFSLGNLKIFKNRCLSLITGEKVSEILIANFLKKNNLSFLSGS